MILLRKFQSHVPATDTSPNSFLFLFHSLSVLTSFKQAFSSSLWFCLISVGLVLTGLLRSGGKTSMLILSTTYLASFVLALVLCLDSAFGLLGKGEKKAEELIMNPLWVSRQQERSSSFAGETDPFLHFWILVAGFSSIFWSFLL